MSGILASAPVARAPLGMPRCALLRALRRAELQVGSRVRVPVEHLPASIRATLVAEAAKLARLGFELCCHERVQPFLRTRRADTWGATLWNESWRSFAVLTATAKPEPQRSLDVWFWSLLRDGSRLLTTSGAGWALVGDDGRTELHDAHAHTLAAHCDAHFERLGALPPERHPVRATQAAFADGTREDARRRIDRMIAAGDLFETRDGAWHLGWRGALRWARILRSRFRSAPG